MTISCLERGITHNPTAENARSIARALFLRTEWLISGNGEKHALTPVQRRIQSAMLALNMETLDLVEAAGSVLTPETVDMWLTGQEDPTDEHLDLISGPLNRQASELKTGMSVVGEGGRVYDAAGIEYDINIGNRYFSDTRLSDMPREYIDLFNRYYNATKDGKMTIKTVSVAVQKINTEEDCDRKLSGEDAG